MTVFAGFSSDEKRTIALPPELFTRLLAEIDDLNELKITLYAFWFFTHQESRIKYMLFTDFKNDEQLIKGLIGSEQTSQAGLQAALQKAVQRNTLLSSQPADQLNDKALFFLNTKEGEAALAAFKQGSWDPSRSGHQEIALAFERPNIFGLYEQHIGILTPMISEMLQEAENNYPPGWIEDAIRAAVKNNVRRWNYVESILKRWREEGRSEEDRRSDPSDRKKYIQGPYGDIIEH